MLCMYFLLWLCGQVHVCNCIYMYMYTQIFGGCPHVWLWLCLYVCSCVHVNSYACLVKYVLMCPARRGVCMAEGCASVLQWDSAACLLQAM